MKVFNTLSRQKEEFVSRGNYVRMYVCGVTPYDECHVGHAMSYVLFDVIRRYLQFKGYSVKYVQNFTDVDDKIIARAQKLGVSPSELAERFIASYFVDMQALNVKRADVYPRATAEIPDILKAVQALIDREYAYPNNGSVYFRVARAYDYGKLSRRDRESLLPQGAVEEKNKENPLDFALWKAAKPGEPFWDSPWGQGRPGWHIECSVMALKYLGETLDIHGGGLDLVFPHHENEIAQSESLTGVVPFARYWLHNGLLCLGDEKMSKSLGNLVTIKEALRLFSPDAIRLFILSSHYRSPLTFSNEAMEAAERGVRRLRQALEMGPSSGKGSPTPGSAVPYHTRFIEAMDDDFNTAQAIAALFELAREINRAAAEEQEAKEMRTVLQELAGVLGLTLEQPARDSGAEPFISLLVSVRDELRAGKQWQLADNIRQKLSELGVALEDSPQGTKWRWKHSPGQDGLK